MGRLYLTLRPGCQPTSDGLRRVLTPSRPTSAQSSSLGRTLLAARVNSPAQTVFPSARSANLPVPDLLDLQRQSFHWLLGDEAWQERVQNAIDAGRKDVPTASGLEEIFEEIARSRTTTGPCRLSFRDHRFEEPKYTEEQCREKDHLLQAAVRHRRVHEQRDRRDQVPDRLHGRLPLMTDKATFIIERHRARRRPQLVRSPGVYFERTADKTTDKDIHRQDHPSRGAWLEFEIDKKDMVGVRDRPQAQAVRSRCC